MSQQQAIQSFLDAERFAVAGASTSRTKYGNKVFRAFLQNDLKAYPINPNEDTIEGHQAYASITALQETLGGSVPHLAIITPPPVTERIVREAVGCGVQAIWMQPGAESEAAIRSATDAGLNVIARGPCLLVQLRFREEA